MLSKGVLCALAMVTAFPIVLSFDFSVYDTMRSVKARLLSHDVYDFSIRDIYGETIPLSFYKEDMLVIINIPFECDPKKISLLNNLASDYYKNGLRVIAFPNEQFSPRFPIDELSTLGAMEKYIKKYNIQFEVYSPVDINGPNTDPLWEYLKASQSLIYNEITEDYTMFLVSKTGIPVKRIPGKPWLQYKRLTALVTQYL